MDEVLIAAYVIVGVFERAFIKASVEAGSNTLVRVNWKRAEAQTHTRKRAYATLTHNGRAGNHTRVQYGLSRTGSSRDRREENLKSICIKGEWNIPLIAAAVATASALTKPVGPFLERYVCLCQFQLYCTRTDIHAHTHTQEHTHTHAHTNTHTIVCLCLCVCILHMYTQEKPVVAESKQVKYCV